MAEQLPPASNNTEAIASDMGRVEEMKMQMLLQMTIIVAALASPAAAAGRCLRQCGGMVIPYPFGIGHGCYLETGDDRVFELSCSNRTTDGAVRPTTAVGGFEVLSIDVLRAKMRVRSPVSSWCYDPSSRSMGQQYIWSYSFDHTPAFRVSGTDNMLAVVGCNTSAYINSWNGGGGGGAADNSSSLWLLGAAGCHAMCSATAAAVQSPAGDDSCNGSDGCCQARMPPPGMRSFKVAFGDGFYSDVNTTGFDFDFDVNTTSAAVAEFNPCSYAAVVEEEPFRLLTTYVAYSQIVRTAGGQLPMVLDWAVGNQTCQEARRNKTYYACRSANSECVDSMNGPGYLCNCSLGYQGNPYLLDGCKDIDECEEMAEYPCHFSAKCHNKPGGFECLSGIEGFSLVAIVTSVSVVVLAVALTCTYLFQEKKRLAAIKRRYFKKHGGLLLFEEMKSRQGHSSFTLFTKEELEQATDKFDERHVLGKGGNGTVYRGELKDGRVVAVKRCRVVADDERQQREFGKEMLILSQVNHRHIVKLYGCCLEVEVPMLVYQFIPNGTLYQLIHQDDGNGGIIPPPSLAARLKIAHEAAEALAYLHSMASPPIIHGDVKSANILLDENYAAKVSDFGASALAPTDEAHLVTLVQGTCGYLDPEYMQTCRLTDKSDVYSFGVVLLELLTRRKALTMLAVPEEERSLAAHFLSSMRDGKLDDLADEWIKGEVSGEVLEIVAALAKRCLEMSGENRPSMREVAEELDRIGKLCRQGRRRLGDRIRITCE